MSERRDELATKLAEAVCGPDRYIGDLSAKEWDHIYEAAAALTPEDGQPLEAPPPAPDSL